MTLSILSQLEESSAIIRSLADQAVTIEQIAVRVRDTVLSNHKVLTCGNGGSSSDAQHLTEELVARYRSNRRALPALSLTADTAVLTCIANDFGYEHIFARQIEALAFPGDLLVCMTTSGNSPNIIAALNRARERGAGTIALLGKDGGAARGLAELEVIVASDNTARIQEAHMQIVHYICEVVEQAVTA